MNEQTQAEPVEAEAPATQPAEAEAAEPESAEDSVVPLEIRLAAAAGLLGAAHKVCQDVLIGLVEPGDALDMIRSQLILALQQLDAVDDLEWLGDENEVEEEAAQ